MSLNKKGILRASLITLLVTGLMIAWLGFGERGFLHLYRMEKERQAYVERIRTLEKANSALLEEILRLRNDKDYIESVARRELGLIREDEVIYRFSKEQEETDPVNDGYQEPEKIGSRDG